MYPREGDASACIRRHQAVALAPGRCTRTLCSHLYAMSEQCGNWCFRPCSEEMSRRRAFLLYYAMRSPVFDRVTLPTLNRVG